MYVYIPTIVYNNTPCASELQTYPFFKPNGMQHQQSHLIVVGYNCIQQLLELLEWMCLKFCRTMSVVVNNGRNVYIATTLFIPSPCFLSYSFIQCFDMDIKSSQIVPTIVYINTQFVAELQTLLFQYYTFELLDQIIVVAYRSVLLHTVHNFKHTHSLDYCCCISFSVHVYITFQRTFNNC